MTNQEAIEILHMMSSTLTLGDTREACRLAVEALKVCEALEEITRGAGLEVWIEHCRGFEVVIYPSSDCTERLSQTTRDTLPAAILEARAKL